MIGPLLLGPLVSDRAELAKEAPTARTSTPVIATLQQLQQRTPFLLQAVGAVLAVGCGEVVDSHCVIDGFGNVGRG